MTRSNLVCLPSLSCNSMGLTKMLHPRTDPGTRVACVAGCASNEFCSYLADMSATTLDGCLRRAVRGHRHRVARVCSVWRRGLRSLRAHENQPVTTDYQLAECTAQY